MQPWNEHPKEEALEQYALGRLPEEHVQSLEEHLLFCGICQHRLESEMEYVQTMRAALTEIRPTSRIPLAGRLARSWGTPFMMVALCFVVALGVGVTFRSGSQDPFSVHLESSRGTVAGATAPEGAPLDLTLDLTGLEAGPNLALRIFDSAGNSVWRTDLTAVAHQAETLAPDTLTPGQYWVRLYRPGSGDSDSALLREFSLRIE